ncbi:MAG: hypothetical protein KKF41_14310 [Actinobacteria bacterium]|nr:hypothetical protein [Actinomycetota bacterium]MBU1942577.1 hypothetical protein [Actinomycetota bacterium]MBU2688747.1 hypothetical protein [Actinomycetota bacterium]
MSIKGRTVVEFQSDADVSAAIERWAGENKYLLKTQDGTWRVYQKGENILVPPMMLAVARTGNAYRMEAWVRFPMINRVMSLGMLPDEARIESEAGKKGFIPRNKLRKEVNTLLGQLGVQPIA